MATALIGGLVTKGADAREFRVVEPLASQHEKLAEQELRKDSSLTQH